MSKYDLKLTERIDLTDLAVIETNDDVMMTEAEEEMTAETTDDMIAETIDVATTGTTALEDMIVETTVPGEMTAEILMETMIGIVQNATIPTLLEE